MKTLDLTEARRRLGDAYSLEYHVELDSTNTVALQRAREGAPAGTLVYTEYQTAGRGRRGDAWTAPPSSSVLMSLLVRPAQPLPPAHLAILTGAGAAAGLAALGIETKIKWPNDLMLDDRKIAGILVETCPGAAVIGIGINCAIATEEFPAEIRQRAGSLHTLTGYAINREEVLAAVAHGLADAVRRVEEGGIVKVLLEWNRRNWLARRKVRVCGPLGAVDGDGLFLNGNRLVWHVFKDGGVVPMPLSSTVEAR